MTIKGVPTVNFTKLFVACGVMAILSVPLILKLVPPNGLYGIRTARALSDSTIWFALNAFGGWCILIAACVSATLLYFSPATLSAEPWFPLAVMAIPLCVAVVAIFVYLNFLK